MILFFIVHHVICNTLAYSCMLCSVHMIVLDTIALSFYASHWIILINH